MCQRRFVLLQKIEVSNQKSPGKASLKIVLTTTVQSFIIIEQKMASKIVTSSEKIRNDTMHDRDA